MSGNMKMVQGETMVLAPVPIKAQDFLKSLQVVGLPADEKAMAVMEMTRMFEALEFFGAWLQPVKVLPRIGIIWKVCFPATSKWKASMPVVGSMRAIHDCYALNQKFPGWRVLEKGDGNSVLTHEAKMDAAIKKKNYAVDNAAQEEAAAREHLKKLQTEGHQIMVEAPTAPKEDTQQ